MHQRTWLSIVTFPLVAAFTYPMLQHPQAQAPRAEASSAAQDPLAGLSDIQDVLALVRDNYVDAPDMEKVINGGIQAALERAHPLNAYLTPEDLRLPDPGPAEIGVKVIKRGITAQIIAVVPGSPAAQAGFQPGDMIRKLDGEGIGSLSAWALERRLRGAEGSPISLLRYAAANGDLKKIDLKRVKLQRPPIEIRKDSKATVLRLPDMEAGRAAELKALLPGLDAKLPLVLDLRQCAGGTLQEAAQLAGLFAGAGTLATIQEPGKADQAVPVVPAGPSGFRVAVLIAPWTLGAPETFASAMKKQALPTFGERTGGLGVERTRLLLRQGGAVEIVHRRWLGAGGEKLDRQGVTPEHPLKGLRPEEDPLPRILEILEAKPKSAAELFVPPKRRPWLPDTQREVA